MLVMKSRVLVQRSALGGDSLWELTWLDVNNIAPSLQTVVFPDQGREQSHHKLEFALIFLVYARTGLEI